MWTHPNRPNSYLLQKNVKKIIDKTIEYANLFTGIKI